mmetsp:Transcript_2/g.9  ORF Transcript_2/g.9 Transcript_2/m.9 type:complete len:130 (-) Transcript_2:87-476(-)
MEFYHYRGAPAEDVPILIERGREIHKALQGGIIPVKRNPETGKTFCSIDAETLNASGGKVEPVTHEELVRRNHKEFNKDELRELQQHLINVGRWHGKLEFDRFHGMKTKKKKCTDPDPPPQPKDEFRVL